MFNASLCKDYSPVGNVIANRSRNLEFAWKLCIHLHFFRIFKCLCKFMFTFTIKRHIRSDMLLCLTQIPQISRFFALVGGESHRGFPHLCSMGSHGFNEIQQKSNSTEN